MKLLQKQKGASFLGLIILIVGFGIIAYLAWAIVPVYMQYSKVVDAMNSLQNNKVFSSADSTSQVQKSIQLFLAKAFRVSDITEVPLTAVLVNRIDRSNITVQISYEVKTPLVANVSLLFNFYNQVTVTGG
jgi:hypothetical protein